MREQVTRVACVLLGVLSASGLGLPLRAEAQDPPAAPVTTERVRPGQGQRLGQARGMGMQADRMDVLELQRLFDAYLIMQAQDALRLDDAQFGQFLPRLKQLQETRRRNEKARQQLVADLARLTLPASTAEDAALKERLLALQDLDGRAVAELRRAYDGVDQLLDVRRQARFRVFEQNMERRKFQLMLRARRSEAGRLDANRVP
jgi:hypothetical protein